MGIPASDLVAAMHGYRRGAAHPTTDLVLFHKHPQAAYDNLLLTANNRVSDTT